MIKKQFFLLWLISISINAFCLQAPEFNIAVNDFSAKGIGRPAAEIISDMLRSELTATGLFKVMKPDTTASILKEKGFQKRDSCDEESCLVEIGQLLGVEKIIAGSVEKVESLYTISLRMINVATGEIMFTDKEDYNGDLRGVITITVANIARKMADSAAGKIDKDSIIRKTVDSANANIAVEISKDSSKMFPEADDTVNTKPVSLPVTLKISSEPEDSISVKNFELKTTSGNPTDKLKTHKKLQWLRRVVFGSLAVGTFSGGLYFNNKASEAGHTYESYKGYNTHVHDSNWQYYKTERWRRNLAYGIAGACTAGLIVSIPF